MTEFELIQIAEQQIESAELRIKAMNHKGVNWIDQGTQGKRAIEALHSAVAALATLIKGAIHANKEG